MSEATQRVKIEGEWREITREDIENFYRYGIGHVERFRIIKSAFQPGLKDYRHSRGKGKKRKQWELR